MGSCGSVGPIEVRVYLGLSRSTSNNFHVAKTSSQAKLSLFDPPVTSTYV
jgi:hypothetical protein